MRTGMVIGDRSRPAVRLDTHKLRNLGWAVLLALSVLLLPGLVLLIKAPRVGSAVILGSMALAVALVTFGVGGAAFSATCAALAGYEAVVSGVSRRTTPARPSGRR